MKKLLALVLSICMMFTLAACGNKAETPDTPEDTTTPEQAEEVKVDFPKKTIRIIVPYAAGGSGDLMSRGMSEYMSKELGVSVIVENLTGGAGSIAIADMLSKEPDGYNIMETAIGPVALNPVINQTDYKTSDLRPICSVLDSPCVILTNANSGIETWDDLLAAAEKNPGAMTYGTSGSGSIHQIAFESALYKLGKTGLFTHVPFDGGAAAVTALLGNKIDVWVGAVSDAKGNLDAGAFNVIAQCGDERIDYLPDAPTLKELGVDFSYTMWSGFFCSAEVPDEIVQILSDAFESCLSDQATVDILNNLGAEINFKAADKFSEMVAQESELYATVMHDALGIG